MRAVDIIIKKKEGCSLTNEEIHFMIQGLVNGTIPDYQISALLMAICFRGMNSLEQFALTKEILYSGEQVDLSSIKGICVDKHSTGGIGDKTTLVIAPIVAACGLKIAKMSGRGLGHTGGTLDKLEAIPGYQINIKSEDFYRQVNEIGIAVIGQTANITPADKKLYALRDVTGTVDSVGLIASSVMSKKLASGAHSIILDVKVGDGAFMKTLDEARVLAKAMVEIGHAFERQIIAVLTDMDEPLGDMVGNSLEVIEAIETLKGRGPASFRKLCYSLSSELLVMTGVAGSMNEAEQLVQETIDSGRALQKFKEMITYQKGNPQVVDDYSIMGTANERIIVKSTESGYIERVEALKIGVAAMVLGAGRENKEDVIDPVVGIEIHKKVGDSIASGEGLATLYTNGKNTMDAYKMVLDAYHISSKPTQKQPLILDIIK
ncbi:MAG: pyrimidine-nucleoside phosphorylase [Bacilli bacterium]|nr:pyrimidine-nucleoside phosphorylase [Bacilli bacterium]